MDSRHLAKGVSMRPLIEQTTYYCDPCHGIAPIMVGSSRDFLAGKGIVVALALIVLGFAIH
jgi:hypothetical protein